MVQSYSLFIPLATNRKDWLRYQMIEFRFTNVFYHSLAA